MTDFSFHSEMLETSEKPFFDSADSGGRLIWKYGYSDVCQRNQKFNTLNERFVYFLASRRKSQSIFGCAVKLNLLVSGNCF